MGATRCEDEWDHHFRTEQHGDEADKGGQLGERDGEDARMSGIWCSARTKSTNGSCGVAASRT
jgi:hypothetical protein